MIATISWTVLLLLAVAGGCGAMLRFTVDSAVARHNPLSFPFGTVVVNATACLAIGLLMGLVSHFDWPAWVSQVLGTGLLGGYSTFSTAMVEGARLVSGGRYAAAILHSGGMLVVCLLAGALGLVIAG